MSERFRHFWLMSMIVLVIFDVASTYAFLELECAEEENRFVAFLLERFGTRMTLFVFFPLWNACYIALAYLGMWVSGKLTSRHASPLGIRFVQSFFYVMAIILAIRNFENIFSNLLVIAEYGPDAFWAVFGL